MAQTVCVIPSAADLAQLSAIVVDRARPLKHIQRARIVLLSAERLSVLDVAQPAGRLALAAALRRRRRRGSLTRQDPPALQAASLHRHRRPGAGPDLLRAARRGHPLDWPRPGAGRRDLPAVGPAHLGCPPPPAASGAQLQALERSGLRRQGRGHRRPLHGSAAPRRRALPRRSFDKLRMRRAGSRLSSATARADPSRQVVPRHRPTTTSATAPRRCLPRSTCWRAP
ncbi:hypothetical protein Maq22A_2p42685 (plasmid) [Methylobacterium aquaticum]|uniref:Uncharacterized protein n=1 Tax=Methylobacterium aquaticum TaxID=270351 RepID=A0A1Y0ZGJ8_9HYPH|nr:hypothetical protein Maq22A_2p42685 [Methylobacterium aquaticum]